MDEPIQCASNGLEGVIVAETTLSKVDGERGQLVVRGHDIEELARWADYETIWGLLVEGGLPDAAGRERIREQLGAGRVYAHGLVDELGRSLDAPDAMEALRSALAQLMTDGAGGDTRPRLAGAAAVFGAAWWRRKIGERPLAPDPARSHADDYLRLVSGCDPALGPVRALNSYLVTVAEHGMNASTFTARVVASTQSDLVSAVVAALGALKGPLHGGAPGPVLDMLDAIGRPEDAAEWLEGELAAGRRIMGLGHRVYRVRDPRAAVLEEATQRLEQDGFASHYLRLARAVERAAVGILANRYPSRTLETNVEFYTAVCLDAIGLPRELFTPTFAVARVAGWLAHAEEQNAGGRIIRPRQRYVGPSPQPSSARA